MVNRIKYRILFFSPWGFMESVYSSNWLTSLHFLKNPLLAYSVRVFQSLKNSVLLLFFRLFRLSRCRISFLRVWFSIKAVYRSKVETLVAAGCSGFSEDLDSSLTCSRFSISLFSSGYFLVGGDMLLLRRHMKINQRYFYSDKDQL